jgi:hypothetical protein
MKKKQRKTPKKTKEESYDKKRVYNSACIPDDTPYDGSSKDLTYTFYSRKLDASKK